MYNVKSKNQKSLFRESQEARMSSRRMKVSKCPSDTLTMTNRAIVNTRDFDKQVNIIDNNVKRIYYRRRCGFSFIPPYH